VTREARLPIKDGRTELPIGARPLRTERTHRMSSAVRLKRAISAVMIHLVRFSRW